MRLPVLLLLAILAPACTPDPLYHCSPRHSHEPDGGPHRNTGDSAGKALPASPPGEHIYLTAVRFPDGFAWQEDTCAVDGTVWIDLYRDGKRVWSTPAGASVHPDMHRFLGGHLYTDESTETETIIRRDGAEAVRFPGREALRGFLVREDGIHTLGQDRDGDGFTYRIDGREVFRSEAGTVLEHPDNRRTGALEERGEDLYYVCRIPTERGWEYRVMKNAEVFRTVPDGTGIRAFGFLDGKTCRVQSSRRKLVLDVDGTESTLSVKGGETAFWCRLYPWEDTVLALVCATGIDGKRIFLQASDGQTFHPESGVDVGDILAEGKRMGWTVVDTAGNLVRFCWSGGGSIDIGPGTFLTSGRCALLRDGHLLLALTGRAGAPNRFRQDAGSTDIPFNGYFTSVTVE